MKIKKLIKYLIIIFLIIIFINLFYSKIIKKDNPIKLFGKSFLVITTNSMEPTIKAGELIIITEKNSYNSGDIITYIDEDDFSVTHRIIKINEKTMITKGDANNINDKETKVDNIKGKVIFHSPILGFFVLYILKPLAIAYAICLLIVYLISIYTNYAKINERSKKFVKKDNIKDEKIDNESKENTNN